MKINLPPTLKASNNQEGAVLIISLILLVVLTMLGISAVEMTKLETKMVSNTIHQNQSFQHTEAGLVKIDENIQFIMNNSSDSSSFDGEVNMDTFTYLPPIEIENNAGEVIYKIDMGIKQVDKIVPISNDEQYQFYLTKSESFFVSHYDGETQENLINVIESAMQIKVPKPEGTTETNI
ncbi:MAG: hypothetical protein KAH84_06895 [Thiomargarita sp.]|nr:hypothetical protein [Thiomargarita sp.]